MARTFLMIKPTAVAAGHVGGIIGKLERSGFTIVAIATRRLTREEAAFFYDVHAGKDFFEPLLDYITSAPTVGVMLEAPDAIAALRRVVGTTDPTSAEPGTIRAEFGASLRRNAVHASDSEERVRHESEVYFRDCPRTLVL
jgi:nucleoside-diphosphate kinase